VASVVSGVDGGVVVVMVSPVVASDVGTGPGVGSSAELTVLNATPGAPMAIAAVAPTVAETSLSFVEFIVGLLHPVSGVARCTAAPPSSEWETSIGSLYIR
jgi:hypothetical protein